MLQGGCAVGNECRQMFFSDEKVTNTVIDAVVYIPNTNYMSAVEGKLHYFGNTEKKNILNSLCDTGTVYQLAEYNPSEMTKKQLQEQIHIYEELLRGYGMEDNKEYYTDMEAMLSKLYKQYEAAPEQGEEPGNYEADSYTGKMNGVLYDFHFYNNKEYQFAKFLLEVHDFSDLNIMYTDSACAVTGYFYDNGSYSICYAGENKSSMMPEDAELEAVRYAEIMGFFGYSACDTCELHWRGNEGIICNGYMVTLTREINGNSVRKDVTLYDMKESIAGLCTSINGYIRIGITDEGLIMCEIMNPVDLVTKESSPMQVLSFDGSLTE